MSAYFYSDIAENKLTQEILTFFKNFAEEHCKQTYIINKPLGTRNYNYDYNSVAVVLISGYKILLVDYNNNKKGLEDFAEEFIEDLGYLSDKHNYKNTIGRPRQWRESLIHCLSPNAETEYSKVLDDIKIKNSQSVRIAQLLISLLTGSINDIDKIGKETPTNILEAVKKKIVIFDGKQTDFIFRNINKKVIKIQGLAGTGKTELLLYKLKELYTDSNNQPSKIALTCFNKILAKNLKDRIPNFFNFLKVDEQIKWDESLFVMSSWGSNNQPYTGMYSYLCSYYKFQFYPYSYDTSFDYVCAQAIDTLKKRGQIEPCFDYILIDESQDFPQSFFDLCDLVTRKQIYIAGDVFQNIFDLSLDIETNPDFLLNTCYRTDPKTLIFSHSLGMGLIDYRKPEEYISWLTDEEWKMCGYDVVRENGEFVISRQPINRFEDMQSSITHSVNIYRSESSEYSMKIIQIIKQLKKDFPTLSPDDIGLVFLENESKNYRLIDGVASEIYNAFNWQINKGYESKTKKEGTLFVSNINNVKGLEFPFIICISRNKISKNLKLRNALYMILTRSFLSSYLLLSDANDEVMVKNLQESFLEIERNGCLKVLEPSDLEKEKKRNAIISKKNINKSQKDIATEIMEKMQVPIEYRAKIHASLRTLLEDENDITVINDAIEKLVGIVS